MIEIADFLLPLYRMAVERAALFIASRGADSAHFSILPANSSAPAGKVADVRYQTSDYGDGDYLAVTTVHTASGAVEFRSGLKTAFHFVKGLFDERANVTELLSFDADSSIVDAANLLGVELDGLLTQGVVAEAPGEHITQTDNGWLVYIVEDRGQTFPIAESIKPALLAYFLHNERREESAGVAERSAALYKQSKTAGR